MLSHPAWGAWIEIFSSFFSFFQEQGRTPHGVRGLKLSGVAATVDTIESHPAWGAWIEITSLYQCGLATAGRTPHGVRGLKSHDVNMLQSKICRRTPHGVRGLKSQKGMPPTRLMRRTPHGVRGLKLSRFNCLGVKLTSHPAWGAWIEIAVSVQEPPPSVSHPAWGAWIEIVAF